MRTETNNIEIKTLTLKKLNKVINNVHLKN